MIDPMADKTLMTVLTCCLAWQGGMPGKSTYDLLESSSLQVDCLSVCLDLHVHQILNYACPSPSTSKAHIQFM